MFEYHDVHSAQRDGYFEILDIYLLHLRWCCVCLRSISQGYRVTLQPCHLVNLMLDKEKVIYPSIGYTYKYIG